MNTKRTGGIELAKRKKKKQSKKINIDAAVVILIVMDSSRLKEEQYNTKPIITINEEYTDSYVRYDGIFYSMRYLTREPQTKENFEPSSIYGGEFWLFNKKLIWSNVK